MTWINLEIDQKQLAIEEKAKTEINDVKDQTSDDILNVLNYIQSFSFVEMNDDWVYINFENIWLRNEFISFVDHVFKNDLYFEGLDYEKFSKILYDFFSFTWTKIRICKSIKKMNQDRIKKYTKPMIFKSDQAEYTFSKVYDQIEENWKLIEIESNLNIDEFVARMWIFWIRYWLKIDEIKEIMKQKKAQRLIIAESLPAEKWIDARLLTLVNLWRDYELKIKSWWNLDLKTYKRTFPQIGENIKLYQKIDLVPWINGMDIKADLILPETPKDINLLELCWEWVEVIEQEWIKFISSIVSWYVTPLQWDYNSKKVWETEKNLMEVSQEQIKWQVKVTKAIELWVVWPETWNIQALWDVTIKWVNNWYFVESKNTNCIWDVYWNLFSENNIEINWNVTWWEHQQSHEQWVRIVRDWKIISFYWNITLKWNALSKSFLQALNWSIEVNNSEASVIIWQNIKVKNARNTIFIWENIEVENATDCMFISTKDVKIIQTKIVRNHENVIFILKPEDYEKKYEEVWILINDLTEKNWRLNQIIADITAKNQQIIWDKMVIWYSNILKKFKNDKNSLIPKELEIMTKMNSWYNQKISEYTENTKKLSQAKELWDKIQTDLEKLNQNFQRLSKLKELQINPKIEIWLNQGPLKILWLIFDNYKQLKDFTQEEIDWLVDLKSLFEKKKFKYELLLETGDSKVIWSFLQK